MSLKAFGVFCIGVAITISLAKESIAQVSFAVPGHTLNDDFVKELVRQSEKSDSPLTAKPVSNSHEALAAVEKGHADLALFFLDAFIQREKNVRLAPVLTQPFLFSSSAELADVQDAGLGEAVLTDIGRAAVIPLTLWNRGLSNIVSKERINTTGKLGGLRVASFSPAAISVLKALDASPNLTDESRFLSPSGDRSALPPIREQTLPILFEKNDAVEVTTEELLRAGLAKSPYVFVGFRPVIGVLAASEPFWDRISEAQKVSLNQQAAAAAQSARVVLKMEEASLGKVRMDAKLPYDHFDQEKMSYLTDVSTRVFFENYGKSRAEWQLQILGRAKLAVQQGSKKRPNLIRRSAHR